MSTTEWEHLEELAAKLEVLRDWRDRALLTGNMALVRRAREQVARAEAQWQRCRARVFGSLVTEAA